MCEKASTLVGFALKHPVYYRLKNWLNDTKEDFEEIAEETFDEIDAKIAKISDWLNEENQKITDEMDDILIDSWDVLTGFPGFLISQIFFL